MKQAIKETIITFLALYLLIMFSGIFNTVNYFFAEKAIAEALSCDIGKSGKPCTCSCNMESAGDCCCCSVDDEAMGQTSQNYLVFKGDCNELPTLFSNYVLLKFVVTGESGHLLFPTEKKYVSMTHSYFEFYNSAIDHPPSNIS
jgi:hypothetical protein